MKSSFFLGRCLLSALLVILIFLFGAAEAAGTYGVSMCGMYLAFATVGHRELAKFRAGGVWRGDSISVAISRHAYFPALHFLIDAGLSPLPSGTVRLNKFVRSNRWIDGCIATVWA